MEEKIEVPRERSNSLTKLLSRRHKITEQNDPVEETKPVMKVFNPLIEFKDIPLSEIIRYQEVFQECDKTSKGFLTFEEIKCAMRKLDTVLTHMELVETIKELNSENEKMIDLREFISIYKVLGAATPFKYNHHKKKVVNQVEVTKIGVGAAKNFFEDKAARTVETAFETELRLEREKIQRKREDDKKRRLNLTAKASAFGEVKQTKTPVLLEVDQALSKLKIRKIKTRKSDEMNISTTGTRGGIHRNASLRSFSSDSGLGKTYSRSASVSSYSSPNT